MRGYIICQKINLPIRHSLSHTLAHYVPFSVVLLNIRMECVNRGSGSLLLLNRELISVVQQ